MLLFNMAWHLFVRGQINEDLSSEWLKVMQYVDNNDTIVDSPEDFQKMLEAIGELSDMVDVPLDHKKTYAWATHIKLRDQLTRVTMQGRGLTFVTGAKTLVSN